MKLDNQFMQKAIIRINELQNEVIEKSKQIEGAESYVQQRLALFDQYQKLRKDFKFIQLQEQQITKNFLHL